MASPAFPLSEDIARPSTEPNKAAGIDQEVDTLQSSGAGDTSTLGPLALAAFNASNGSAARGRVVADNTVFVGKEHNGTAGIMQPGSGRAK